MLHLVDLNAARQLFNGHPFHVRPTRLKKMVDTEAVGFPASANNIASSPSSQNRPNTVLGKGFFFASSTQASLLDPKKLVPKCLHIAVS